MDQLTNGGGVSRQHAADAADFSSMPAEFGALYQAGYEAGYEKGYAEGHRDARPNASAKPETAASPAPSRRRGLLGLPCDRCGTFLYSDETRCPHCDRRG